MVPNKAAMDGLDPDLVTAFPNIGMAPADMLKQEQMRDLGEAHVGAKSHSGLDVEAQPAAEVNEGRLLGLGFGEDPQLVEDRLSLVGKRRRGT